MPTVGSTDGQNVFVTTLRRAPRLLAALLAPALLLSGCGGDGGSDKPKAEPTADLPQGNVEVPEGITLTKAGTQLKFGEPAYVAYEPNTQRSSVLSMTVDSVQLGAMRDFAAYQLDDRTKKSRPYYVRVVVKNEGVGDLSRAPVPLLAVNDSNALVQPSSFTTNTFAKCPSAPLPAGFVGGKAYTGCLVYLVPDGGTLVEMSYRPLQAFEPITWKGAVLPATPVKDKKKAGGQGKKSKNKKKAKP
jgi:hypothetical protein